MAEGMAMKAATEEERIALRAILARSEHPRTVECPCGWFYIGPRCPDKNCVEWKKANGKRRITLTVHADEDRAYEEGKAVLGLEGEALETFTRWGVEIVFDAEVNLETGEVKLLTVDGHKIFPVKG